MSNLILLSVYDDTMYLMMYKSEGPGCLEIMWQKPVWGLGS